MVSVRSVVVTLVALVVLTCPHSAPADTIGPVCWNMVIPAAGMAPAVSSPFVLIFTNVEQFAPSSIVPSNATVMGANRAGGPGFPPPVSGAALGAAGLVSMVLTVAPESGRPPLFINVQFLLTTGLGEGHCTGGGAATCGDGKAVTWVLIPCESIP